MVRGRMDAVPIRVKLVGFQIGAERSQKRGAIHFGAVIGFAEIGKKGLDRTLPIGQPGSDFFRHAKAANPRQRDHITPVSGFAE